MQKVAHSKREELSEIIKDGTKKEKVQLYKRTGRTDDAKDHEYSRTDKLTNHSDIE